jgi:hypothetical protein
MIKHKVIDKRRIKDSIACGLNREKSAAFSAVPEIIKHGIVFQKQSYPISTQWSKI